MAEDGELKKEISEEAGNIRVHANLKKRIERFIQEFYEKNGVELSFPQATKIIDDKIEKQGGLKVPTLN